MKMDEYIKRKTVKELINMDYDDYHDAIDRIPAANVAPIVHGRWDITEGIIENAVCSNCGRHFQSYYEAYHYCPNCGARMDEAEPDFSIELVRKDRY